MIYIYIYIYICRPKVSVYSVERHDDWWITNWKWSWPNLSQWQYFTGGTEENLERPQNNSRPGQDSNRPANEWKQEALSVEPLCSVASEGEVEEISEDAAENGTSFGCNRSAEYRWYTRPAISARDYGISHWNERLFLLWWDSWLVRSLILQYIRGAQTTRATQFFRRFVLSTAFSVIYWFIRIYVLTRSFASRAHILTHEILKQEVLGRINRLLSFDTTRITQKTRFLYCWI
jgi:hypothetical protein